MSQPITPSVHHHAHDISLRPLIWAADLSTTVSICPTMHTETPRHASTHLYLYDCSVSHPTQLPRGTSNRQYSETVEKSNEQTTATPTSSQSSGTSPSLHTTIIDAYQVYRIS